MPPSSRCAVARLREFSSAAAQRQRTAAAAVVVFRRPVILFAGAASRHPIGGSVIVVVADQRIRLQAVAERREVAERLDGGAGLARRLGRAVELAQRIGEAAAHRQDAAGLVLQHDHRALHDRPDAQLGARAALPLASVTRTKTTSWSASLRCAAALSTASGRIRPSARPTRQASSLLAARLLHHHRRRPMHVVERQPRIRERLLPGRPLVGSERFLGGLDALDGLSPGWPRRPRNCSRPVLRS